MEYNQCAICGVTVNGRINGVPRYYCGECFNVWEAEILSKAPWLVYLLGIEKGRRKARARRLSYGWQDPASLDQLMVWSPV